MKRILVVTLLLSACACARPEFASDGVRRVAESSLRVEVSCDMDVVGYGSAVAISPEAALTARHVVEHDECASGNLTFRTIDYRGTVEYVRVKRVSRDTDVALLSSDIGARIFRNYAGISTDPVELGERLFIFAGTSADLREPGLNFTLKEALAGNYVAYDGARYLVASVHLVPGNSGGGVFDVRGRLVGIVNKGSWFPDQEFRVLAAPADQLAAFLSVKSIR